MGARVTSSRFVGRTGELAECDLALREAAARRPSIIAVGGESGVGKSRLVRAFEAGTGVPARFLRGDCVDLGDGELPYAPLTAALRELVRCGDPALERLGPGWLSELSALLPGIGPAPARSGEEDSAQLRLFEAILELLGTLGEEAPVVLVIEDLHWADRSTRAFTAFLARSLRRERVLFLFTYRSDELHRRHPLLPLLSELERGERTRRLSLRPWGREELEEALADILGAPPGAELLERLLARSEGNPLYTEELLAAGLDGRGTTPQSLRDAFMLRLERLPAESQAALRVLAVARSADEPLLAELADLDSDTATEALREAVSGHVLEPDGDGRLVFRHALLREVAYGDLLPGERAALHLRLAHVLEQRRRDGVENPGANAQIAAHAHAGGDRRLALTASVAAAEQAAAIHAHGEAAELLERALEAWPHVPDAARACGLDHVELLLRAASAHELDEQRARGEAMLHAALEELGEDGPAGRRALVLERLARARWNLSRGDEALATARRALDLLPEGAADRQRAELLAWLARTTMLRGRYRDAIAAAQGALETIAASGAGARVESQARNTLGMALAECGQIEEGIAELRHALELAERAGEPWILDGAYVNLADVLLNTGRTAEALAVAREGLARMPQQLPGPRAWLAATVAETAFAAGSWQLAMSSLRQTSSAPEGRWLLNERLRRAELALGQGRLDDAALDLEEIEQLADRSLEPQFLGSFGLALADLHRRRGDLEDARKAIEEALDRIELCTEDIRRVTAIAAAGVAVEADLAQLAADQGDEEGLRRARMLAELHAARVRAGAESAGPVEAAWGQTAEAELRRALGEDDPVLWQRAARAWETLERPYARARVLLRTAEAHLSRGQRGDAARTIAQARAVAVSLGASWLVDELDSLAARARLAPAEPGEGADGTGRDEETELPFGLTRRELEVLALVSRGATNREIGQRLFMAEKTASVHVSRILAKLDVRSRTEAAAVAHRAGLGAAPQPLAARRGHPGTGA